MNKFICGHCGSGLYVLNDVFVCPKGCILKKNERWFTFLIKLNLNRTKNPYDQTQGDNWREFVVYRSGANFEQARQKIKEDFDEMILFACSDKIKPIRGELLESKEGFTVDTDYSLVLAR